MIDVRKQVRVGFTLIELMIAIAIVAILAMISIPSMLKYREDGRIASVASNLRAFESAITQYNLQFGKWPSRLKDLVQPPSDEKDKAKWTGSFFKSKELPEDPWGNNYVYKMNPAGSENPYELYSYGKNGKGAPQNEWISVWKL